MKKIVYDDGGVLAVISIAPGYAERFGGMDEAVEAMSNELARIGFAHDVVEDGDIPEDRTFRRAWKLDRDAVVVDLSVAVEIQKDRLREMRTPILESLDVEYIRAVEDGDKAAQNAIVAKKRALRDVTDHESLGDARTPAELKEAGVEVILQARRR